MLARIVLFLPILLFVTPVSATSISCESRPEDPRSCAIFFNWNTSPTEILRTYKSISYEVEEMLRRAEPGPQKERFQALWDTVSHITSGWETFGLAEGAYKFLLENIDEATGKPNLQVLESIDTRARDLIFKPGEGLNVPVIIIKISSRAYGCIPHKICISPDFARWQSKAIQKKRGELVRIRNRLEKKIQ